MNRRLMTSHHHSHPSPNWLSRCDICGLPRFIARWVGAR